MKFAIERYSEKGFQLIRLTDNNSGTYAVLIPANGALLHEFVIMQDGRPQNIIDNYKDATELESFIDLSYKSAKMSPFACRIANGKWTYETAELEFGKKFRDGNAIHGLLFNKPFRITEELADETGAAISLRYHYNREDNGYPFDYVCEIRYVLQAQNVLRLETTITNLDDDAIPLVDGWHPYFTLGGKVNDWIFQLASDTMLEFDERLIPTGDEVEEHAFHNPVVIGETSIDNCFVLSAAPGSACAVIQNPANGLTLSIFASEAYPYLQVFTPDHRQSIAIENLSGAPDAFNNGIGLTTLEPRRSKTFNAWYVISR
ncbi:MAG: aldose 1-epimerase [Chitinophagaceae bacterium]|nr:MAG: aldose 1-epimerase [Chitinophagaceae bacterium]